MHCAWFRLWVQGTRAVDPEMCKRGVLVLHPSQPGLSVAPVPRKRPPELALLQPSQVT